MTQMGLDYEKHLESMRHNKEMEGINAKEADTKRMSYQLDKDRYDTYAEREMKAKEDTASSQVRTSFANQRNAATNEKQAAIDERGMKLKEKAIDSEIAENYASVEKNAVSRFNNLINALKGIGVNLGVADADLGALVALTEYAGNTDNTVVSQWLKSIEDSIAQGKQVVKSGNPQARKFENNMNQILAGPAGHGLEAKPSVLEQNLKAKERKQSELLRNMQNKNARTLKGR